MKNLKIGVLGAGKLGQSVIKTGAISAVLSQSYVDDKIFITNNLPEFIEKCDVIIDCSSEGFNQRMEQINKPIVIATTQQIEKYPNTATIIMPNGSFSWNLIHDALTKLAQSAKYEFVITDIHHKMKKDSPSGTARRLIDALQKHGATVSCISARTFDVTGIHTIYAFNEHEAIKIEHQVFDRAVFAAGLIIAANWIAQQKPGVYTASDMIAGR